MAIIAHPDEWRRYGAARFDRNPLRRLATRLYEAVPVAVATGEDDLLDRVGMLHLETVRRLPQHSRGGAR